jgi:hypothetical protein
MDQPTFADLEYQGQKRKTRREPLLESSETAKRATGKPAKNTERLTLFLGLGNLPTAKGTWGLSACSNRPGPWLALSPQRPTQGHNSMT